MRDQSPDVSEYIAASESEELRRIIADLQNKLRRATTKTADLILAVREGARDAATVLGNPPKVPAPKPDKRTKKPEAALLHLSDWQWGKVTPSFNSDVATARVNLLAQEVVHLTEIERADHPVHECHVMLGGDFVEGVSIFPGQAHEIDSTLFEQMFSCTSALQRLLRTLLASFERVIVWEEKGNHGRLGRKGDHPASDSADLLVYSLAKERMAAEQDEGRLHWNSFDPEEPVGTIVAVGNYRALLAHGDEIKQFGGNTPAFGISRKVNAWAAGVLDAFDDAYLGHFHTPLVLPLASGKGRIFVNPSIESDSVYAKEFVAASGTPGQRLNFVEPGRGRVTSERLVYLDSV